MPTTYSKEDLAIAKKAIEKSLNMMPYDDKSISMQDSIGIQFKPDLLIIGYVPVSKNMMRLFAQGYPHKGLIEQLLYNSIKKTLDSTFITLDSCELADPDLIKKIKEYSKITKERHRERLKVYK